MTEEKKSRKPKQESAKDSGKKDKKEESTKSVNSIVAEEEAVQKESVGKTGKKDNKTLLIAGAVVVALALIAGTLYMTGNLPLIGGITGSNKAAVATVNGEKITRAELNKRIEQNKSSYEAQGADLSDPAVYSEVERQALDFMVNEELILQDAASRNIAATSEEVEEQFQNTIGNFPDETSFENALKENGLTRETLNENIETQLIIQKYFDEIIPEESVAVSEEEVSEFYTEYKTQNPEAPALEELAPQIENLLKEQKTQAEVEKLLASLRDNAEVEILL